MSSLLCASDQYPLPFNAIPWTDAGVSRVSSTSKSYDRTLSCDSNQYVGSFTTLSKPNCVSISCTWNCRPSS